ncbi:MAG TPA: TolC family protein [Candidatus Deferrimicrobium sp.]|nr:TolC family protein [Candidatus Deferrimicrobium sp.]
MNRKYVLPILILSFLAFGTAGHVTAAEVKALTLEKAIEIALEANINLKQADNQVALGKIAVNRDKANFLPDLGLSARASERYAKDYDPLTGKYSNVNNGSLTLGASSSFNLFNGFYDTASLQQSKLELKGTGEDAVRTRQTIIFETIQRFIAVITAREMIRVEKENLEAQRILLSQIEAFYKSGKRPVTDFYQQSAQISNAEYRLLNAERDYDVSKLLLMQIMGLQPGSDYEVEDPGIDSLVTNVLQFQREEELSQALAKRPDLKAQEWFIEAARFEIKAARSGYWPKLSLSADYGTSYSGQVNYLNFSDQLFKSNPSGAVGLSLTIPLFDKSRTRYSVAVAEINLRNQQLEMERLNQQVALDIQQAIEDYQTAAKQMNVSETQLKYSKDALDSMQERYNVNAATMVELTQTRAQYLQSIYNRLQAKFNLLIRGIAVAFYKGDYDAMISRLKTK